MTEGSTTSVVTQMESVIRTFCTEGIKYRYMQMKWRHDEIMAYLNMFYKKY